MVGDSMKAVLAFCLAIAGARSASGQRNPVFHGAPAASWIAPPNVPGDSFLVFHARRSFDLDTAPTRFLVHVSADNRYRLYLNGQLRSEERRVGKEGRVRGGAEHCERNRR